MIKFLKHNWVKLLSIPVILAITIMTVMFAFPAAALDPSKGIDVFLDLIGFVPPIGNVIQFVDFIYDMNAWLEIDTRALQPEELLVAWREMVQATGISEDDFAEYWNTCINDYGLADERLIMIEETVRYGLTLSDVIAYAYAPATDNCTLTDKGEVKLSPERFQDIVNRLSEQYGPKNTSNRHSWQTDKAYNTHLSFFSEGTFFNSGLSEIYCVPFFYNGKTKDTYYYSLCQLHFYQSVSQDEDGNNVVSLYMDYYNWFDESETSTYLVTSDLASIRYMRFPDITCAQLTFRGFTKYSDFITYSNGSYIPVSDVSIDPSYDLSDLTLNTTMTWQATLPWAIRYTTNSAAEIADQDYADYGFFYSSAPINMGAYDIDFDRFPDDCSIIAGGDTIYDYSIVDNTTGDTTTINNYITNNYTYPDDDSGENGGNNSGGQTSGNVTVSGDINVGGKVEVDVNVNINHEDNSSGNGGAGESENPSDYIDPGTVEGDISEYLKQVPEISSNVINWLKGMISWLPKEIYGLIILGLVVAIFCRLNGR